MSFYFLSLFLCLALLTGFGTAGQVQAQSTSGNKKNNTKAESCDGAADIVPAKPMSFVRKRRPAQKENATDAKTEKKS